MSTKTSQKTEDMLDQTFANFDSEVTGAETQQTVVGNARSSGGKKGGNNMMVFIGAGVAAVGAIAWLFVIKPALEPEVPPKRPMPVVNKAPEAPKPVEAAKTPETSPAQNTAPVAPVEQAQPMPVAPVEAAKAPETVPVQNAMPVAPVEQAQPMPVVPVDAPKAPETVPVQNAMPVAPVEQAQPMPVVPVDAPKAMATIDELKNMFDQQTNEFRNVLTNIDGRIGRIESVLNEQKDINNKFDQRLLALETGKKLVVQKSQSEPSVKKIVQKSAKKPLVVKKEEKTNESLDSSVLVDKSSDLQKEKVVVNNLPKLNLHSIYAGRVWVKNSDGSLSTFSAGDKLPTGEVIKAVDDERFEIATDKRVIKH